jgi:hypothetical protein
MARCVMIFMLLFAVHQAEAAACGQTANRAGCVGANGAVGYNKNTGVAHGGRTYQSNQVAPGAHVEGVRGNSATKAVAPGCAYVNGRRVCN